MILVKSELINDYLKIDLPIPVLPSEESSLISVHTNQQYYRPSPDQEILPTQKPQVASVTIRADILKNKVLKYLRIKREERHQYYLSWYKGEGGSGDDGVAGVASRKQEVVIADSELIEGAQLSMPSNQVNGNGVASAAVEPLIVRLGRYSWMQQ